MTAKAKPKVAAKKAAPVKKIIKPSHPLMINDQAWDREAVGTIVCDHIATSTRSIGAILKAGHQGNTLPSFSTFMKWLTEDIDLSDKYAKAKEAQAELMGDEMLDIADDGRNDWMERNNGEGENPGYSLNGEHVQRSRLRIETRKWLMGKLKAKKYGDKVEHVGEGGGAIQHAMSIAVSFVGADKR